MRKRRAFVAIAVGFSILIALAVSELSVRLFIRLHGGTVYDSVLGMRGSSGGEHDAWGYRNVEVPEQADIIVLGDSQTYGINATRETAWPQVLGEITDERVYQMAYGGWSIAQYDAALDQALSLHPQEIVIALYTGNDMHEVVERVYADERWAELRDKNYAASSTAFLNKDIRTAVQHGYEIGSAGFLFYKWHEGLSRRVKTYALISTAIRDAGARIFLRDRDERKKERVEAFIAANPDLAYRVPLPNTSTVLSPSYRLTSVDLDVPSVAEGWRLTRVFLERIRARVPDTVQLKIVLIPTMELAYIDALRAMGEPVPEQFHRYGQAEERLWNEMLSYCEHEHFQCIPLVEALSQALERGEQVYRNDFNGHPTAAGYRVLAEEIARARENF